MFDWQKMECSEGPDGTDKRHMLFVEASVAMNESERRMFLCSQLLFHPCMSAKWQCAPFAPSVKWWLGECWDVLTISCQKADPPRRRRSHHSKRWGRFICIKYVQLTFGGEALPTCLRIIKKHLNTLRYWLSSDKSGNNNVPYPKRCGESYVCIKKQSRTEGCSACLASCEKITDSCLQTRKWSSIFFYKEFNYF